MNTSTRVRTCTYMYMDVAGIYIPFFSYGTCAIIVQDVLRHLDLLVEVTVLNQLFRIYWFHLQEIGSILHRETTLISGTWKSKCDNYDSLCIWKARVLHKSSWLNLYMYTYLVLHTYMYCTYSTQAHIIHAHAPCSTESK